MPIDGARAVPGQPGSLRLRLPAGELAIGEERSMTVRLSVNRKSRDRVRALLDAVANEDIDVFWRPERVDEDTSGLELAYPMLRVGSVALSQAIGAWRRNASIRVPLVLDLARFLACGAQALIRRDAIGFTFSSAFVSYTPASSDPWRIALVPSLGTTLNDWARADPVVWSWTSPRVLLSQTPTDWVYAIGAVLHDCLIGSLFPATLSHRECFRRMLCARVGTPGPLDSVLERALPPGLERESQELSAFISAALDAHRTPRLSWEAARRKLDDLAEALAPVRLATRWEHEGRGNLGLALLHSYADSAPRERIPWYVVARLREAHGDLEGAVAAWGESLSSDPDEAPRPFAAFIRRLAAHGPSTRPLLDQALETLKRVASERQDESLRLILAHFDARLLGDGEVALRWLSAPFRNEWHQILAYMIEARVLSVASDKAIPVSRLCKAARVQIASLPMGGGTVGTYVTAYLLVLDAVAHIAAVGQLKQLDFYREAFDRLSKAFNLATICDAQDLLVACAGWLSWMASVCRALPEPSLRFIHLGATALLQTQRALEVAPAAAASPTIPWYRDDILFPGSSA